MRYSAIAIFLFLLISCNDHSGKRSRTNGDNIDTVKKTAAYKMEISYANQITRAGKEITFKLRPVNIADKSIGILETIHEKKIHLIVVSTDLSYFRHLHPDADTGGKYSIRIAFPHGGHYLLFADYKAQGAIQKADTTGIDVAGDTVPAIKYTIAKMSSPVDGFTATLSTKNAGLTTNNENMLLLKLTKKGDRILPAQLQNYLGEKAHMVIINPQTRQYIHVHPMSDDTSIMFHTSFTDAGIYRGWVEFKMNNAVHTADFVLEVTPGVKKDDNGMGDMHGH